MKEQLDPELQEELDLFINSNLIAERVKSLHSVERAENSYEPTFTFGHTFGNFDFTNELDMRIKEVENTQTIGEYIESLYREKEKESPNFLRSVGIKRDYKSKVVNGRIQPSKGKLLCFAIAFELDLEGTEKLLQKAGYTLSKENSVFDLIVSFFIEKGHYYGIDIDIYLEEYDQPTLFSVA
ncbi:hypothetical protein [Aquibacillus rhizosphaerae]|uniref:Uncharacterized protein n=1 Tax=Aquibacillus rhizosphaerae TaxID=3051431 RepID=A0ABT7L6V9_9BACI|nr:hypothetical protein [Aquibacillus sp. LR5S19]MDL4840325.1 hypothetical protein [Aquibacillus sp. LR5S19]